MTWWQDPMLLILAQTTLAVIFGVTGASKLAAMQEFAGVVRNYRVLPEWAAAPVAHALPPLELLVAFGLLFAVTRPLAASAALVLLAVFAVAMAINLLRGRREIDCGCFFGKAPRQHRLSWWSVGRNLTLIAMAGVVLLAPHAARPMLWSDAVGGVAGAAALILTYLALEQAFRRFDLDNGAAPEEHGHG